MSTNKNSIYSFLEIKSLVLPVRIGQTEQERQNPQDISFNMTLGFTQALNDEKTDKLKNSVCYFKICERVKQLTNQNQFALVEKLAFEILTALKAELPAYTRVQVRVQKLKAPVPHLKGGVSYTCGDFVNG